MGAVETWAPKSFLWKPSLAGWVGSPRRLLGSVCTELSLPTKCQWEAEPNMVCGNVYATSPGITSHEVSGGLCITSHCVINANICKQFTTFTNVTLTPIWICSLKRD